jgi:SH3-like domain-containing protein/Na+-transporting methylmalonyl-CoA/oxaloacetate decarboxylase gamma subunit
MLVTWDNSKLDTTKNDLKKVSKELANLNQIPKASPIILTEFNNKSTEKDVRNKVLGLKGIITANKVYLSQQPGNSLSSTWLELGSIVFKTLITNPSTKVSQTVPLKYYLPKEIKKENIIEVDDTVTVQYDTEKDQYYIKGDFVLSPGTTKTVSVRVDDSIFAVSDDEISSLRQQAIDLSEPLKNTSYFAQGATLKSDIDAALSKAVSLQKSATTPEEKIRAYREAKIEIDQAVAKIEKLKEVTTTAGSVGTLFGFVGGTQALAVWGLIIIMAAGFVFLVIYMRVLRFNGSAVSPAITEHEVISPASKKSKKTASQTDDVVLGIPVHHTSNRIKHLKFAAIVVSVGIIASAATAAFSNRSVADTKPAPKTAAAAVTATSDQVFGASETAPAAEKIKIFVPKDSVLNVLNQPSLDATVAAVLDVSQDGYQLDSKDEWVKIKTTVEQKEVTGWISLDFVEKELPAVETKIPSVTAPVAATAKSPEFVTINDTSVGFLRVRQSPWGKEITRVIPGEKFKFVSEEKGWISIHLEDGTLGWVAKQYVTVTN